MFKSLIAYRIAAEWAAHAHELEAALDAESFQPCGPTQRVSAGWVPPRGEPGAQLLERVDGHWLMTLRVEKRILPAAVVRAHVDELAERIEQETGRRPGKKQRKDLSDQAELELLPQAFTSQRDIKVWISPEQRLLLVDAASLSKADDVVTLLIRADSSLRLHLLQTAESPASCMAVWLMDGVPPADFVIDRECELQAPDEMKARVRYDRHNLDTDEIKHHITSGKMPTRISMTWRERVSFTLTDTALIKGIKFLDIVFDGRDKPAKDEAFDVDAALATGELAQLIPDLVEALGGEIDFIGQSAKIAAEHAPRAGLHQPSPELPEIMALARERGFLTVALLAETFGIGGNRAQSVMQSLLEVEIVGPPNGYGHHPLLERESA